MVDVLPVVLTGALMFLIVFGQALKIPDPVIRAFSGCIALIVLWTWIYPVRLDVPPAYGAPIGSVLSLMIVAGAFAVLVRGRRQR